MGTQKWMSLLAAVAVAAAWAPGDAHAERPRGTYIEPVGEPRPAEATGPGLILFFNKSGGTYKPGNTNDSRTNTSQIPIATATISAWSCGDAVWQQFMTCMRDMYGPYNVMITDQDPGATPHVETVVGGTPGQLKTQQYPNGLPCSAGGCVGGIAPLGCYGGVDNAVTFVFANASVYQCNAQAICETAAQESAHAFGLDHVGYCPDPMTYESGCGKKKFADVEAACGEFKNQPRACKCPGAGNTQNSHKELLAMFGAKPVGNPPSVSFAAPAAGATVSAGFTAQVNASDDTGVTKVELLVDGSVVGTRTAAPWSFVAPTSLAPGAHMLTARATDTANTTNTSTIAITLATPPACQNPADCAGGLVCQAGACVPGPGTPGGLGETCADGTECSSGLCGAGPGGMRCTEPCDPAAPACPMGFECLPTGAGGGACWPGAGTIDPGPGAGDDPDDVSGNCGCQAGTSPASLASGLLVFLAVLGARPRRRRHS